MALEFFIWVPDVFAHLAKASTVVAPPGPKTEVELPGREDTRNAMREGEVGKAGWLTPGSTKVELPYFTHYTGNNSLCQELFYVY